MRGKTYDDSNWMRSEVLREAAKQEFANSIAATISRFEQASLTETIRAHQVEASLGSGALSPREKERGRFCVMNALKMLAAARSSFYSGNPVEGQ